ncbi:SLATT domain-containing protein, partial [Pseudomonas syringae pv. syringae]|nr:SLATT domain-containing protein [Pseudomonas syringae pv. syringae]
MKKDSVWFTYKARIQAHKRLEWLDFHSQLLLVWYAILSTALGVLTIRHSTILGPDTDVMATILSVALLGISLAVANRDFRGRAMLMRTNYLALQKLHRGLPECSPTSPPPP